MERLTSTNEDTVLIVNIQCRSPPYICVCVCVCVFVFVCALEKPKGEELNHAVREITNVIHHTQNRTKKMLLRSNAINRIETKH